MLLDLITILAIALAVFKGIRKGLVVALFSFLAAVVGIAAAIKFSAVAADYIAVHWEISNQWTPVLGFLLVFGITVALVRLGAKLIESTIEMATLGWLNKLGGVVFYLLLYLLILSILIFYGEKSGLAPENLADGSLSYPWLEPWGPAVIDLLGMLVPWFRDMFSVLEDVFGRLAEH